MTLLEESAPAIIFVIGLVISTVIIFIITKLFGGRTNIGKAFITAIIEALVWVYYLVSLWTWITGNCSRRYSLVISIKGNISP
jgi:uncharacterized membrane protein